jgi:hypothetical protein
MGKFNSALKAEFKSSKIWSLTKPLTYYTNDILDKIDLWRIAIDLLNYNNSIHELLATNSFYETLIDIGANGNETLIIRVPTGFQTDLASVPRPLWWLIAPTDVARAAVIHDFLYTIFELYIDRNKNLDKRRKQHLRKLCDKVFYYAMLDSRPKVPMWKINATYRAVRWFGWSAIKGY